MARLVFTTNDLPQVDLRNAHRRRVLLLMSRYGTATQEAVMPLAVLRDAGVDVVIGSDATGEIAFDGPCNLLASLERFWSPVHRLYRELRAEGLQAHKVDVTNLAWVEQFDAVLIPGGHGAYYGAFIRSTFVQDIIRAFASRDRLVALQCHSVAAAALRGRRGESPLGYGRQVTCWPSAYERVLSRLPVVGRHFLPLGALTQDLVAPVTGRVHVSANPRRMPHVVVDGPLLTSWGPWSGDLMARALVAMIETRARDQRNCEWEVRRVA